MSITSFNWGSEYPTISACASYFQKIPKVTVIANGNYVISWRDDNSIIFDEHLIPASA